MYIWIRWKVNMYNVAEGESSLYMSIKHIHYEKNQDQRIRSAILYGTIERICTYTK